MMDRSEAITIMEREYFALDLTHHRELMNPDRPLKDMLTAISRAKDEVADADRYAALAREMLEKAADPPSARNAAERCAEVALVYKKIRGVEARSMRGGLRRSCVSACKAVRVRR